MSKNKLSNPFTVVGKLKVQNSATVICLRRNKNAPKYKLIKKEFMPKTKKNVPVLDNAVNSLFTTMDEIEFLDGWEVLMGQNEVVNWPRSTTEKTATMRYPAEFKFAGGNLDENETWEDAARRELEEEYFLPMGTKLPSNAMLRPFCVKQTMPIRSKSNVMWNYVALASENPWMKEYDDLTFFNNKLQERRDKFEVLINSGKFFSMTKEEKEEVSPEVHALEWVPLHKAVAMTLSTMVQGGMWYEVNNFQREQFKKFGIKRRDPMFMTCCALFEVAAFPSEESIIRYCDEKQLTTFDGMEKERQRVQWLYPGMTNEDVINGGRKGEGEPAEVVPPAPKVQRRREQRLLEDKRLNISRL